MTQKVHEYLMTKQEYIIDEWVNNPLILDEFKAAKIPPHFFRNFFAPRVFEHLIKILGNEAPEGDCPAMGAMLRFFKNHDISPKTLYRVCSTFRNKIVKYLVESGFFSLQYYNYALDILDRNFERILVEYIELNFAPINGVSTSAEVELIPAAIETQQCPVVEQHETIMKQNTISAAVFHQNNVIESDDINDLNSLDESIHDAIYSADSSGGDLSHIHNIMYLFSKFGTGLSLMGEFRSLSEALIGMANVLDSRVDDLTEEIITNLLVMLEALANDINKWLEAIFYNRDAEDIHYLDASMIASAQQCITILQNSNAQESEEDLDDIFF